MASVAAQGFRVAGILADAAHLIAAVLFIPFVILAIGAPFALIIAGLLWLARVVF
jgi:hypothetical protein